MSGSILLAVLRWVVATGLLWTAWHFATTGQEPTNLERLLIAAAAFLGAFVLLWNPLIRLATKPLLALIDLVFSPGGRLERPLLNLKLPAHYLNEGRYDEALAEYRKILRHYPHEIEAYEKAIWILCRISNRPDEAMKLIRRARRRGVPLDDRIARLIQDPRP